MPVITLPDGSQKTFAEPVTIMQVAESIGQDLANAALAGQVNDQLVDTSYLIEKDTHIRIITSKDEAGLEIIRHSTAHLLAQKDWVGLAFKKMEKYGCNIQMTFVQIILKTREMKIYFIPHDQCDGIAGLNQLLGKYGYDVGCHLGVRRAARPLGFNKKIKLLMLVLKSMVKKYPLMLWHAYDKTAINAPVAPGMSWCIFEPEETQRILKYAASQKIDITNLMLLSLDQITKKYLLKENIVSHWFFPVNIRNIVAKQFSDSNGIAGLILTMDQHTTARDLQRSIKKQMWGREYWVWWWFMRINCYIGNQLLFKYYFSEKHHLTGTFSYFGAWENQYKPDEVVWHGAPPANFCTPVAAGAGTWNGRMGFAMQIHSTLVKTREEIDFYCAQWAAKLQELTREGTVQ